MNFRFTRHARNRMRLYGITVEDVEVAFRDPSTAPEAEGNRTILVEKPQAKFSHTPLKVVYIDEQDSHVVLSVYPLKRTYRRPQS